MKKMFLYTFLLFQLVTCCFGASSAGGGENIEKIDLKFFEKFQDEILINNILKGYQNNLDLKIANSKIKESEKIVKLSLGEELPAINFEGLVGRTFASSNLERGNNNFMINNYKQSRFLLPLTVSYEIDLWGKNHLKTKSKKQSLKVIEQDKKTTEILLESAIAADYYNLIKIDKLLELDNKLYELNSKLLKIVEKKKQAGLANSGDVLAVKEILVQTQQSIYNLEAKKDVLEHQLSYLLGDKLFSPVERANFNSVKNFNNIPLELNSSIILNRPDMISAQENITKADYDARIAKKEILPSFTILGTFGFNGYNNLAKLFSSNTGLAELFVVPNFDIFDGGRKYNLLKLRKLEYERARLEYEKTVLASLEEVNNSLALLKKEDKNYKLSKNIFDIQKEKTRLKLVNKNIGLASEIDYILYQTSCILAQENYVSDKINHVISAINLYKSVGGVDFSENL